jgi:hypothetical protein
MPFILISWRGCILQLTSRYVIAVVVLRSGFCCAKLFTVDFNWYFIEEVYFRIIRSHLIDGSSSHGYKQFVLFPSVIIFKQKNWLAYLLDRCFHLDCVKRTFSVLSLCTVSPKLLKT